MNAAAFAIAVLQALPYLLQAGAEVGALVNSAVASLKAMQAEGRDPTAAEWAALNATMGETLAALAAKAAPGA